MPGIDRITVFCFAASYAVAFAFELLYQLRRVPILRVLSLGFGLAGVLAHTLFVLVQPLLLSSPFGSLIFLGWILSVFYCYGALHHRRVAWALFVLPLVLGLSILAGISTRGDGERGADRLWELPLTSDGLRFWGQVHGVLVLLAAVGVCVGFVASVMYLVQARRLQAKMLPGRGVRMLSLERLETMNRRAVTWAFPLLTLGLIVGVALALHHNEPWVGWHNTKLVSVGVLWVVFAILLYLRYAAHARGRRVAVWTIVAFGLLVVSLASPVHPFVSGGMP
jgi:ABC-type transport system involved in cytochrome c biogenesis permease subunit